MSRTGGLLNLVAVHGGYLLTNTLYAGSNRHQRRVYEGQHFIDHCF